MRVDKLASLRQRLRRNADAFDFNALINGVSTLEEPAEQEAEPKDKAPAKEAAPPVEPPKRRGAGSAASKRAAAQEPVASAPVAPVAPAPAKPAALPAEPALAPEVPVVETASAEAPVAAVPPPAEPIPAPVVAEAPAPAVPEPVSLAPPTVVAPPVVAVAPPALVESEAPDLVLRPVEPDTVQRGAARVKRDARAAVSAPKDERLRAAVYALGDRLTPEIRLMASAMRDGDTDEAGFRLAHVNQLLELLASIDPSGDLARQYETPCAPPVGQAWFGTAWSVAEFAESPLSALLPADADEAFVRRIMYAAWGVAYE